MPRTKRDYTERLAEIEQREAAAKVKIDTIRAENAVCKIGNVKKNAKHVPNA